MKANSKQQQQENNRERKQQGYYYYYYWKEEVELEKLLCVQSRLLWQEQVAMW